MTEAALIALAVKQSTAIVALEQGVEYAVSMMGSEGSVIQVTNAEGQ
jgi:hypothetical protein